MAQQSNRAMFETFIRELTESFPYVMKYVAPSVISVRNCIDEIARLRQEGKEVTDDTRRDILIRNLVFNPKNRSCLKAMEDFYCAYWFVRQYKQDPRPFDNILVSNPYRYVRFHRTNRLPIDEVTQAKRREMLHFVADALRQGLKVEDLQNVDESIEYLWERAGTQENAVNSSDDDFMLTEGKGIFSQAQKEKTAQKGKGLLDRYVDMTRSTDPVTEDEKGYEVSPEGWYAISNAVLHKMFDEFNIVPTERDESYVDALKNRRLRSRVTGERPPYSEAQIVTMLLQAIPAIFFVRGNRNYIYSDRLQVAEEALQREQRLQNASPVQTRAPPPSPSGEGMNKRRGISEQQLIKHAREIALRHGIQGRGLFSKIKEHAKKAVGWLKDKALPIAKDVGLSGFQALSNAMRAEARKKGIPARDLQKGELHIGLSNWSG